MDLRWLTQSSGFVTYSCFKESAFTAVIRDASSKLGIRKGYHLSMEGKLKEFLFCQIWYIKG